MPYMITEVTFHHWYYALGIEQAAEEALKLNVPLALIEEWVKNVPTVGSDWP